jgi:uncharacterized protein (DUF433 family)
MKAASDRELVSALIEPDPYHPGPMDVVVRERHVPVWALVNYFVAVDGDTARVASDYDISTDAVRAALAYYKAHREIIDARLAANDG